MYQASMRVKVQPLTDVPLWTTGAPLPVVLATDVTLDLVYIVVEPDPNWDGKHIVATNLDSPNKAVARVQFENCAAHLFGAPNDETWAGHPLARHGLEPYCAAEVLHSPWIDELIRMNSVHPMHSDRMYSRQHHFIFMFHDTTFECVAESYAIQVVRSSVRSVVASLVESLR